MFKSELPPKSPPTSARVFTAFAVQPVLNAGLARLWFPLMWYMRGDAGQLLNPGEVATGFAVFTGMVALLVTLCGAVPVFSWLRKRGPISFGQTVAAGVVLGNAPVAVIAAGALYFTLVHIIGGTIGEHLSPPADILAGFLRLIVLGSVLGAVSAAVFWLLAVRGTDIDR